MTRIDGRFVRFLFVGAINTLFGYGCFVGLVFLGLPYPLALLLGTILGVLFNFKTTGTLVFANQDHRRLVRFVAVYALLYVLNLLGLKVLIGAGLSVYLASALLILPMALVSYHLNASFVFRETS